MVKSPKCGAAVSESEKRLGVRKMHVKMYKCGCGNQFREYFHKGKLKFILSAHDESLAPRKKMRKIRRP